MTTRMFSTHIPFRVYWDYLSVKRKILTVLLLCIGCPTALAMILIAMRHAYIVPTRAVIGYMWLISMLLVFSVLLYMAYRILAHAIITPMQALSKTITHIRDGRYDVQCDIGSHDEFGMCADIIHAMIKNIRAMIDDQTWQTLIMQTLYTVLMTITDIAQDEQAMLEKILGDIQVVLPYSVATICVYDEDTHALTMTNRIGSTTSICVGTCMDVNAMCGAGQVLHAKAPILLSNPTLPCYPDPDDNPKSWLGVPIQMGSRLLGVLSLESDSRTFTDDDTLLLQAIASQLASVMIHYRYVFELEDSNRALTEERRMFAEGAVTVLKWQCPAPYPIIYASPNTERIFERDPDTLTNRDFLYADLVYPDDVDTLIAETETAIADPKTYCIEHRPYRIVTPTGSIRWLYDFTTIIRDERGTATYLLGYVFDMTAQKEADAMLIRLKAAIETVEVGVTISDPHGVIVYTNPAEAAMHGYASPDALIGQPANILGDPRLRKPGFNYTAITHTRDSGNFSRESRNIQRNGLVFPVHLISSRLYDDEGVYVGTITVSENITERKQYELRLKHQNRELDMMAKALAHDLMNPARGLEAMSQILLDDYAPALQPDGRRVCTLINQYAIRMARMIDASRQHARTGERLELSPISSLAPIRWALDQLSTVRDRIAVTIPTTSYMILGDVTSLGQVFQNLLENAIKFAKPRSTPTMTISQTPYRHILEYRVHDDGIGIEPRYREKVFTLFHQITPTHPPYTSDDDMYGLGMGMGLALAKKILEHHSGSIRVVDPEPDFSTGTTFALTVPLSSPNSGAPPYDENSPSA